MSSTNKTVNYELSQYIGSDKPTYLVDYNGDMLKIDTGMAANKAQADATDLVVAGHTSSISGLQGTVSDQGTAITGLRTDVDGNTGSINTINSLIGNGQPTTTDKTIIGAINEINAKTTESYICKGLDVEIANATADGVKTNKVLLDELFAAVNTYKAGLSNNEKFRYSRFIINSGLYSIPLNNEAYGKTDTLKTVLIQRVVVSDTSIKIHEVEFNGNTNKWVMDTVDSNGFATTSYLNAAPEAGAEYKIYADIYEEF